MAEPWLDSLSEDWKSEHHSSSPSASIADKFASNNNSTRSHSSRIPHLRQSLRQDSVNGSYLQPRSTKGIARSRTLPVLAERSASSLNVSTQHHQVSGSEKRRSSLPRRASSAFSDSQQSVQHHTLQHRSTRGNDPPTPEWKKRLARGEDVAGEGIDLFGPSKLEGVFKQPGPKRDAFVKQDFSSSGQQAPWTQLSLSTISNSFEQPQTLRTSVRHRPGMEVLEELEEDDPPLSAFPEVDTGLNGTGSLRGFVKGRVVSLERKHTQASLAGSPKSATYRINSATSASNDPRLRSISGQEELLNEDLSPVTLSKQNTIRDQALRESLDVEADELLRRLQELTVESSVRPSSRSSDREVQYGHQRNISEQRSRDDSNLELTTHSLPEDLSMGTQEFVSRGGYVSQKRGGYSTENSFQRRTLSSSMAPADQEPGRLTYNVSNIQSSPPPYPETRYGLGDDSRLAASLPATPSSASVVRHPESHGRPISTSSPLKLFGNRDTYTNNKLLRVLSQFEEADSALNDDSESTSVLEQDPDVNFRMSEFGKGELDGFGFEQTLERHGVFAPRTQQTDHLPVRADTSTKKTLASSSQISRPVVTPTDPGEPIDQLHKSKRMPNSPQKERTPKRRRTLLGDELQIPMFEEAAKSEMTGHKSRLAGTKHRDSRPEMNGTEADPDVLASRSMLRPRSTKRRSSTSVQHVLDGIANSEERHAADEADTDLTQALAAELATFANGVTQAATDSRKPSLATKDYMEEANKVMQFIRAKGKPKRSLTNIEEPTELSELNPDAILDLDIDGDSTKDSFSRPPSREGPRIIRPNKRIPQHDPRTANHLRKFKDQDDLELLASTSMMGTLHLVDNNAAQDAALVPVPDEEQESSPPNVRIRNSNETQRKRKHSTSTLERPVSSHNEQLQNTQSSSGNSSRQTFPTSSSNSSGNRGMITSGTVSIPDQVGRMTFDHTRKVWVREGEKEAEDKQDPRRKQETTSEEDPFEDIPDLSVDERQEEAVRTASQSSTNAKTLDDDMKRTSEQPGRISQKETGCREGGIRSIPSPGPVSSKGKRQEVNQEGSDAQNSVRSQISEHELLIHNGQSSRPPENGNNVNKQPRVVTIAFSSPLVSAIDYNDGVVSDVDLDEPDDLPLDDSELSAVTPVSARATSWAQKIRDAKSQKETATNLSARHDQYRAMTLNRRPVSRIEEREEEEEVNVEMSIVHVTNTGIVTPAPPPQTKAMSLPQTGRRNTSIIELTPLSEFTLHQVDNVRDPEESYVGRRAHPKSLRPAHGSLALAVDDLMRAITDAEPTELFWEQVRRLNLTGKGLSNLHGLSEYCSTLEELAVRDNRLTQLDGLPESIRMLDADENSLSDLTSWGHLYNLQYLNVSRNELQSLDGFALLLHLRELIVCDNHVKSMDSVFDLDGLLTLVLAGNELTHVNFEGTELTRLTRLDLSRNRLTAVRNLQALTSLEELNLEENDLRGLSIPEGATLAKLKVLRLSSNQLETIDFTQFPALEKLYLDNNRIKDVRGLQEARKLMVLSLREQNDSPDIINLIFSTPSQCRDIYLSSNFVPSGPLQLPESPHFNVRNLEIASCGIEAIPEKFGDYFPNCCTLNLNFNAIKEIGGLQGMVRLERLLLAGNRIKRLRRTCLVLVRLGGGPGLREVDLRENPLSVGFYAPMPSGVLADNEYEIGNGNVEKDKKWLKLMDEVTSQKRRMVELMLADRCEGLERLNGFDFKGVRTWDEGVGDRVWELLMGRGVLKQANAILPSPTEKGGEVECEEGNDERSLMID